MFDAIAEYKVHKQQSTVNPDSVRRGKDSLLRVQELRINNAAGTLEREDIRATVAGG